MYSFIEFVSYKILTMEDFIDKLSAYFGKMIHFPLWEIEEILKVHVISVWSRTDTHIHAHSCKESPKCSMSFHNYNLFMNNIMLSLLGSK